MLISTQGEKGSANLLSKVCRCASSSIQRMTDPVLQPCASETTVYQLPWGTSGLRLQDPPTTVSRSPEYKGDMSVRCCNLRYRSRQAFKMSDSKICNQIKATVRCNAGQNQLLVLAQSVWTQQYMHTTIGLHCG